MEDIFDLTANQQRAFNRLKKAYKDCEKEGINFVNRYGSLYAYDAKNISGFGDSHIHAYGDNEVAVIDIVREGQYINIPSEWCDDDGCHYYGLTEKGFKLYENNR
ncbi:hypothetical protein LCGC14_0371130 [marine sediment metagenome]|uniref:Uncharacterized protein n=1 Tax=marine sediment metagenome TaxID=412755 RepID=A0A0F9TNC8_9ZZZZ|nr:hypothetical protein [Maribacter sp.]HDZ04869.1 hypothetical protein [Maribacter sp.]HEA80844.1 hypothetical protein [Maribacter sp.]